MKRRAAAFAALWAVVAIGIFSGSGCYGRNCEGDVATYGALAGEGRMIDETTWESSPPDGTWLPFPRQRFYRFELGALGGRTPVKVLPYVSSDPQPNRTGRDQTVASGNLTLIYNLGPNRVDVKNDSCSDYFLRLVVDVPPFPPGPGAAMPEVREAGVDAADASDQ